MTKRASKTKPIEQPTEATPDNAIASARTVEVNESVTPKFAEGLIVDLSPDSPHDKLARIASEIAALIPDSGQAQEALTVARMQIEYALTLVE